MDFPQETPVSSSRDSQELLATAFGRGHPDVPADAGGTCVN